MRSLCVQRSLLLRTLFKDIANTRPLTTSIILRAPDGYNRTKSSRGEESDSEKWLRLMSDTESGFSSTFEDEDGNIISPRGNLSKATPLKSKKPVATTDRNTSFIDWKRVLFNGGNGGDGCISFLHTIHTEFAGPDGGDGGNGGHVILKANTNIKSLAGVRSAYRAESGQHGEGKDIIGRSGEHIFIEVPLGTLVRRFDGTILADLDIDGSMYIAARGGAGGKGNHFFLSNKNRHPRIAEVGGKGEEHRYILEMKCVAHVGLVGFPNVGKSTLLRAISRARPRVACYPFTTLNPYVGVVQFDDYVQLAVADLPGLIPGAHENRGLGIDFLKHVERCVCLMYVIDLSISEPWSQLEDLIHELECFKPGLSRKPHAIIGNKYDHPNAPENLEKLKEFLIQQAPEGTLPLPVIPVSAKFGGNIKEFIDHMRGLYDLYHEEKVENNESFEW